MNEVELTSELMISLIEGMQDKKKSIDSFYMKYDSDYPMRKDVERKFKRVIDEINSIFPESIKGTQFRRTPLFYSLFLAIAHRLFGVPNVNLAGGGVKSLSSPEREKFKTTIESLSNIITDARADEPVGGHNTAFVTASLSQTDNIRPRQTRLRTIYNRAF